MNNRSSVNETNLVNFSAELPTLNQLDTKDGLLTFPFDHIYACHSEGTETRQTLQLDKELEITTQCVEAEEKEPLPDAAEVAKLRERLTNIDKQNKALKGLIAYHLDLIQQQNEVFCRTEKLLNNAVKENEILKNRLSRADRRLPASQRQSVLSSNVVKYPPPVATVTSKTIKKEPEPPVPPLPAPPPTPLPPPPPPPPPPQPKTNMLNNILSPETSTYTIESEENPKPYQDPYVLPRNVPPEVSYLTDEISVAQLLNNSLNSANKFTTMIELGQSPFNLKKELRPEKRMYTATSNSATPAAPRVQKGRRRTASSIGSMSRMPKPAPVPKVEPPEPKVVEVEKTYERFSVNKKSKMINTYGKPRCTNMKKTSQLTGSLSDRLRLIDTTPTGEDPYLLGEAEMREQSPIPKLMLQKTNHGRMKVCTDTAADNEASMRFYESLINSDPKEDPTKIELGKYNLTNTYVHPEELADETLKTIDEDAEIDVVKLEPEINWRTYNMSKPGNETSLCDFSYGETSKNLATNMLPSLDSVEFQNLFSADSTLNLDNLGQEIYAPAPLKPAPVKKKKRVASTSSLTNDKAAVGGKPKRRISKTKAPKRKRALSTTGLTKAPKRETSQKTIGTPKPKPVKKAASRVKKTVAPATTTPAPFQAMVGDPDLWYLMDPKPEDIDAPGDAKASTVEVPRWREKPYTCCYSLEGTENMDDKVFEKRHQKFEAEERRQLRWHMRRIREQRHVERLRQRHRDSWCSPSTSTAPDPSYNEWPQPQRDARFIQITDTLPVMAFGDIVPALPESEFVLPWAKNPTAAKKKKRSNTLY